MPKKNAPDTSKEDQRPVFRQYLGDKKEVELVSGQIERAFWAKVGEHDGPPVILPIGAEFLCTPELFRELFYAGKLRPFLSAKASYEVIRKFRTVQDGAFVDLAPGSIVELSLSEALELLRKKLINFHTEGQEDATEPTAQAKISQ